MKKMLVLALMVVLLGGCAKRRVMPSFEAEKIPAAREMGKVMRSPADEGSVSDEKEFEVIESEDIQETVPSVDEIKEPEQVKLTEEEMSSIFRDIHFDFDRYDISDEDKPVLKAIADWMISHPASKLVMEGHSDERGTNEYNLGLSDRRARAAMEYLASIGISAGRMLHVAYGEEKPVCSEHYDDCWWKNRRVHFEVINEGESK